MALAKSHFLVAAPVNYRAACAARYRKFSNHPSNGSGQESFIVAAPVNYRAAHAARYIKFSIIHQMALAKSFRGGGTCQLKSSACSRVQ